jgi:hypothetical protein
MIGHELGKRGHEPSPDLPDGFQMTELGALPRGDAGVACWRPKKSAPRPTGR